MLGTYGASLICLSNIFILNITTTLSSRYFSFHLQRKKVKQWLTKATKAPHQGPVCTPSSGGVAEEEAAGPSKRLYLPPKLAVPGRGLQREDSGEATDLEPVYKVVWPHFSLESDIK